MNAYAVFAADEALRLATGRVTDLRHESTQRRMWSNQHRTGRRGPIETLISSLRGVFAADEAQPLVPALTGYPFRS